jgi:hypothetical protein
MCRCAGHCVALRVAGGPFRMALPALAVALRPKEKNALRRLYALVLEHFVRLFVLVLVCLLFVCFFVCLFLCVFVSGPSFVRSFVCLLWIARPNG